MPQAQLAYPFAAVRQVTQVYGNLANTSEPASHGYAHFHAGIDLGAPYGTQILASGTGTVVIAGWDTTGFGNLTKIHYDNGLWVLYGHQQTILVSVGDTVHVGQVIGLVGSTGNSSGPHLHFEVRTGGGGFGADVDPAPYLTGTATLPTGVGSVGPVLPGAQSGGGAATKDYTGQTPDDLQMWDPTTQAITGKPLDRDVALTLAQVRVAPETLATRDGLAPHCLLAVHLSATQTVYLPVLDAQVTTTSVLQPGSWSATLSLVDLQSARYAAAMSALMGRTRTQVSVLMGSVADPRTASPDQLIPLITGVVDGPNRARYSATSMQLPVRGTDLSGLLSAAWATGTLSDDAIANKTASQIATQLATHSGLHSVVADTADPVGGYDGQDTLLARQGQTDWDLLTQLAQQTNYVCYVDGTTLYFYDLANPPPQVVPQSAPLALSFAQTGQPPGLIEEVEVAQQAHSKHEYKVVVQSYNTTTKTAQTGTSATMRTAGSGNPDAPTIVTLAAPPNLSQKEVQRRADAALADYARKEVVITLQVAGALALPRLATVRLLSDRIWSGFTTGAGGLLFQVAKVTYTYSASGSAAGIRQQIVATSRPLGLESQDQANTLDVSTL